MMITICAVYKGLLLLYFPNAHGGSSVHNDVWTTNDLVTIKSILFILPFCYAKATADKKFLCKQAFLKFMPSCHSCLLFKRAKKSFSFASFHEGVPMGQDYACNLTNTHHVDINHVIKYLAIVRNVARDNHQILRCQVVRMISEPLEIVRVIRVQIR